MPFIWIKNGGGRQKHHIKNRHLQKNSPLTNKYQETLTSYNNEMFLSLAAPCALVKGTVEKKKSFPPFGNPVRDRLTHVATDAWGCWNSVA